MKNQDGKENEEVDVRCGAHVALLPDSTLEERRCPKPAGQWYFEAFDGHRQLCDAHAKSYREQGFGLQKSNEE